MVRFVELRIIKNNGLATKVIAVDAVGSVIFGDEQKKRLIPGHGAAIVPIIMMESLTSAYMYLRYRMP